MVFTSLRETTVFTSWRNLLIITEKAAYCLNITEGVAVFLSYFHVTEGGAVFTPQRELLSSHHRGSCFLLITEGAAVLHN